MDSIRNTRMLTHAQSPFFHRSEDPLALGRWHELRVSRTAKNGILQVDKQKVVEGMAEVRTHSCSRWCVGAVSFLSWRQSGEAHGRQSQAAWLNLSPPPGKLLNFSLLQL